MNVHVREDRWNNEEIGKDSTSNKYTMYEAQDDAKKSDVKEDRLPSWEVQHEGYKYL